jgi:hypothetical protein
MYNPRQQLNERRFSCAIFAHKSMNFTRPQIKGGVNQH